MFGRGFRCLLVAVAMLAPLSGARSQPPVIDDLEVVYDFYLGGITTLNQLYQGHSVIGHRRLRFRSRPATWNPIRRPAMATQPCHRPRAALRRRLRARLRSYPESQQAQAERHVREHFPAGLPAARPPDG